MLSVCERKSRVRNLYHLPDKSSAKTMKAIVTVLHGHMVSSITYDNRLESAMHELVNDLLDCESYFCRPYHSWEKGWGDDYNRVVRQYFPKGYDFATITSARLLEVEEEINHRPRNISRLPVPERPP